MNKKRWVFAFSTVLFFSLGLIAALNYWVDPLFIYSHAPGVERYKVHDEREVKSNYVRWDNQTYEAILLGSSRVANMDESYFPYRAFNYGVSSAYHEEFAGYLSHFIRYKGVPRIIIIGLDFYAANENHLLIKPAGPPEVYLKKIYDPLYRLRYTLNKHVLNYAWHDWTQTETEQWYTRQLKKHVIMNSPDRYHALLHQGLAAYKETVYGDKIFQYDQNYQKYLSDLKMKFPNTEFIVFTNPESQALYCTMLQEGRWNDYQRWLQESVQVFGHIHHFMGITPFTRNQKNYMDMQHFYPKASAELIKNLSIVTDTTIQKILTPENVAKKLEHEKVFAIKACSSTAM